ncbi:MAG: transcription antitermination factor NusB [Candidatus Margulisiibacteriota bacterium]|jgi:N utilization substance protein B
MSKRQTSRKLAIFCLYQAEIQKKPITEIIESYLLSSSHITETKEFAKFLAQKAWDNKKESDKIIEKHSLNWSLDRINVLDKCILNLAIFELRFTDTPKNVVLNEAIEIAKKYSAIDSTKFINGILDNFIKESCSLA